MSDTIIFIIGGGVFALTTTATLIYGYLSFQDKAKADGVLTDVDDPTGVDADGETDTEEMEAVASSAAELAALRSVPAQITRVLPSAAAR